MRARWDNRAAMSSRLRNVQPVASRDWPHRRYADCRCFCRSYPSRAADVFAPGGHCDAGSRGMAANVGIDRTGLERCVRSRTDAPDVIGHIAI